MTNEQTKIFKKELEEYAKERANEVESIDFEELMQLVIDGALWAVKNVTK